MKIRYPKKGALREYHQKRRMEMSDFILKYYFGIILAQCKLHGRSDEALLEYQNELEFRGLKYRL